MGKKLKKRLCPILAVAMLVAVLLPGLTPKAAALQYEGSATYQAGKYYRALVDVQLTGDPRTDIVNVALSQLGYQEGGNRHLLSGEVYGGLNFTEYGRWYGMADMWCAIFVSWCANVSGVPTDVIPKHAYTPDGLRFFRNRGQSWTQAQIAAGEYTPRAGDLIYFRSSRNQNTTNHVGLVTGCSGGLIYTVEGNISAFYQVTNGGMVAAHSYPIDDRYIVAVCVPDYEQSGTSVSRYDPLATLRSAVITAENAGYDRISTAYGPSIALGIGQWYGARAQELLQAIRREETDTFAALDTSGIGEDLDSVDWSCYQPSEEKLACIRAILTSDPGRRIQNFLLERQLSDHLTMAEDLGVTDLRAQALCALVRHMGGTAAVDQLLSQVDDLSYETLFAALPRRLLPAAELL